MSRIHEALKRAEREKGLAPVAEPPPAHGGGTDPIAAESGKRVAGPPAAPAPAVPAAVAAPARAADASARGIAAVPPPPANLPAPLGSCRRVSWQEDRATLFFLNGQRPTFATEQFRALRSRLYQFRDSRRLKSVLVTSAGPGEGKTFVCANLGYALARQSERRVLLIDAHLSSPGLHTILGAPNELGLAAFLRGEAGVEKVLQRGPHENLWLIPGGQAALNPGNLLTGGRLRDLLEPLEPLFDWILLDSPAAEPVSNALEIARWCQGVLLVVEGGRTTRGAAQNVVPEFRSKGLLGVVLNRTEPIAN